VTAELVIVRRDVFRVRGAKLQKWVLIGVRREAASWKGNGIVCQPHTYSVAVAHAIYRVFITF